MSIRYESQKIEQKWQRFWQKEGLFGAKDFSRKPKKYILVEFPYPSGEGLHVGHCRPYIALDLVARKRRMEGFNVLFPMGWDAFGLPTENYAIKTGIHPRIATKKNTDFFRRQQKSLGLSFDWGREINTTDPAYYKWTQWIFVQLFNKELAYKTKIPINWCPACKISLANEEVVDGRCERCGAKVTKKEKEQWMLKITKYAERLLEDLEKVDYPERVKVLQRGWIGKSEGTEIKFSIFNSQFSIDVFTTRLDTIFGATYLVIAPEHPILENLKFQISNLKTIEVYIEKAKRKLERERISETKEKTGIKLEGVRAINPATGKEIPIFVADYVLPHYGTGAIMAVPCHDTRDFEFAKAHNLPMVEVIRPGKKQRKEPGFALSDGRSQSTYTGEGTLVNSGEFNGMKSQVARERIREWLERKELAKEAMHYKLRDWIFSRQRYWGEPIPMIKCEKCGWLPVSERDLPVKLPDVKQYKPTQKGESPLAKVETWVNTKCPKCAGPAKRETDVMPNWAGSNWYYLRYCDPKNDKKLAGPKLLHYWMPVDWYNGGMEHTTLHLLYSRFIYKFLWDIGAVPKSLGSEPYRKRTSHGIVLGEGGIKMSKSRGNVITPEQVIKQYGADTLRIYEMFMGPFEQMIAWDTKGVRGVKRFLDKVWKLSDQSLRLRECKNSPNLKKLLHKTIKKVSQDIELLKFNTAVSSLMEFSNAWQEDREGLGKEEFENFLKILSPFAPHLAEELWEIIGHSDSIFKESWPEYDSSLIESNIVGMAIQINGKLRGALKISKKSSKEEVIKKAKALQAIEKRLKDKDIEKTIFVPGKIINFVVSEK